MDSEPVYKVGYIHVKFPSSKTKGIRVKPWKRKWVVMHEMSDLSMRKSVAKIDIYQNEESSKKKHPEKHSIILENITAIKRSKSRTHPYACNLLDLEPVLCLAGDSETDIQSWIKYLRKIFCPPSDATKVLISNDAFEVSLIDSADTERANISGSFHLKISPAYLQLLSPVDGTLKYKWNVTSIKRFFMAPSSIPCDFNKILVILVGNLVKDEKYFFFCDEAPKLLTLIYNNVTVATKYFKSDIDVKIETPKPTETADSIRKVRRFSSDELNDSVDMLQFGDNSEDCEEYSRLNFHASSFKNKETHRRSRTFSGDENTNKFERKMVHSYSADQLMMNVGGEDAFLDEDGYSHLPGQLEHCSTEIKDRTLSCSSSASQKSNTSRLSRDSGITMLKNQQVDECEIETKEIRNDSFDSAVTDLYSRVTGPFKKQEVTGGENNLKAIRKTISGYENIDIPWSITSIRPIDNKYSSKDNGYENIDLYKVKRSASNPESKLTIKDDIYEELEVEETLPCKKDLNSLLGVDRNVNLSEGYKKNLGKFLGYDEKDRDKPPSLPERPSSVTLRRKGISEKQKNRGRWSNALQNTLRRRKAASSDELRDRSSSSSSSTSSNSDDDVNSLIHKIEICSDNSDTAKDRARTFNEGSHNVSWLARQTSFKVSNYVMENDIYDKIDPTSVVSNINMQPSSSNVPSNSINSIRLSGPPIPPRPSKNTNITCSTNIDKGITPPIDLLTGDPLPTSTCSTDSILKPSETFCCDNLWLMEESAFNDSQMLTPTKTVDVMNSWANFEILSPFGSPTSVKGSQLLTPRKTGSNDMNSWANFENCSTFGGTSQTSVKESKMSTPIKTSNDDMISWETFEVCSPVGSPNNDPFDSSWAYRAIGLEPNESKRNSPHYDTGNSSLVPSDDASKNESLKTDESFHRLVCNNNSKAHLNRNMFQQQTVQHSRQSSNPFLIPSFLFEETYIDMAQTTQRSTTTSPCTMTHDEGVYVTMKH